MGKELLYKDLAKYYDLLYHWKDYEKESNELIRIIRKNKKSNGKKLLEVACGTGRHISYLKYYYNCVGTDINKGILDIAKKKNPDVGFIKSDMVEMKLEQSFDIIISLFGSVGYVRTYTNLKRTIKNFSDHLVKGGIMIIEPWLSPDSFKSGTPHMTIYEDKDLKIARLNVSKKKGNISILDMHYLIAEKGNSVKHLSDHHELGLFSKERTIEILKKNKISVRYLKKGFMEDRGLFVGIKK